MDLAPLGLNTLTLKSNVIISQTLLRIAKPFCILVANTLFYPFHISLGLQSVNPSWEIALFGVVVSPSSARQW